MVNILFPFKLNRLSSVQKQAGDVNAGSDVNAGTNVNFVMENGAHLNLAVYNKKKYVHANKCIRILLKAGARINESMLGIDIIQMH